MTVLAAALSLLALPAVADGKVFTDPVTANLDDDPVLEQVIPQEVCLPPGAAVVPPCAPDQFTQQQVVIADSSPRALFRYPSKYTRGRVPRKAKSLSTFDATLRNVRKAYAGKEIRLRETYVNSNDALCCPSFERITLFGYNAGMDLYVKFRSTVKRIKKK